MPDEMNEEQRVSLILTPAEALVLFDWLSRWAPTSAASIPVDHRAEQRVLWDLLARLERALAEPFMPDYHERLDRARESVQDAEE
jgi:hypothetical protein